MGIWITRIIPYGKLFRSWPRVVVSGNWGVRAKLGSGDDLVWSGGQREFDAGVVIRLDGGRDVERGELNVFRPLAALPVISVGVKSAAYDRVFGHLFAMAVAKDQNGRCEFGLSWLSSDRRR